MSIATLLAQKADDEQANTGFTTGLRWAMLVTDALSSMLRGTQAYVNISAWGSWQASGLFLHDEVQGKAVRLGCNASTGSGRLFWGNSLDFEFPSRDPKPSIAESNMRNFDETELAATVDFIYEFFTNTSQRA